MELLVTFECSFYIIHYNKLLLPHPLTGGGRLCFRCLQDNSENYERILMKISIGVEKGITDYISMEII